jgi:type IV pilus biogenesis/stability protein PilW
MKRLLPIVVVLALCSCATKSEVVEPPSSHPPSRKAEGYYQIGVSYLRLGEVPLALNYFYRAKRLNPKDAKIYNAIGVAFLRKGDLDLAEENFKKAVELKQDFSEAYLNLGIVEESKGNFAKAREYYEMALANPLYLTPEVAYYRLALLDIKEGKRESARRNLSMAIRNNPDYIPAHIELAKLLEKEGNIEGAKEIYFHLISAYPELQFPYCALGDIYFRAGKKKTAKKYYKKCAQTNPDSVLGVRARMRLEEMNE